MIHKYIQRSLEQVVKRAVKEFPAIVMTGPRQSGKTTLLKHLFAQTHRYVSLELPDVRAAASADPRAFLEMNLPPVIFDEVQYAPDLLPYIKEHIDSNRDKKGQYLLTGSQNLILMERITESLAGRAAMLRLLPLSYREAMGCPSASLPWELNNISCERPGLSYQKLWESFLRGGYPEIVTEPDRDFLLWQSSYVQTYFERDVRTLRQVGDLTLFQIFLRALASRSGQLLNLTDIARDIGIAVNTSKAWLSILEATYQVFVLRPYFGNIGKQLVKTPKVYFTDVGTLCYLSGLKDPEHVSLGPMGGAIFETAVFSEIMKVLTHRGENPQVNFWRTTAGTEVDFVIESGGKLIPVEAKLSATPRPGMATGIRTFQKDFGDRATTGFVIHPGDVCLPLSPKVTALPFARL